MSAAAAALNPTVTILVCICSAAAVVLLGMATHKLYSKYAHQETNFNQRTQVQDDYMRELRERNVEAIYRETVGGGYPHGPGMRQHDGVKPMRS